MDWSQADRISDRIVDIINEERTKPGFNPTQALAGQLLALMALLSTAPSLRPKAVIEVQSAAEACLNTMRQHLKGS